jgi:DNA-nicking Smr family endonuclease
MSHQEDRRLSFFIIESSESDCPDQNKKDDARQETDESMLEKIVAGRNNPDSRVDL